MPTSGTRSGTRRLSTGPIAPGQRPRPNFRHPQASEPSRARHHPRRERVSLGGGVVRGHRVEWPHAYGSLRSPSVGVVTSRRPSLHPASRLGCLAAGLHVATPAVCAVLVCGITVVDVRRRPPRCERDAAAPQSHGSQAPGMSPARTQRRLYVERWLCYAVPSCRSAFLSEGADRT